MTTHEKLKADLQKELGELFSTINPITILAMFNHCGNTNKKAFIELLAKHCNDDAETVLFLGLEFKEALHQFMKIWDEFESKSKRLLAEEN